MISCEDNDGNGQCICSNNNNSHASDRLFVCSLISPVMSQRRHYVAYAASRESGDKKYNYTTSCMTQERLQKLKELGLDLAAATTVPTSSQTVAAVKVEEEDSREEAPTLPAVSTPSKKQKRTEDELHPEPRRPPKKRKKSPLRMAEMARSSEPEQRDASPQQPEVRTTSVERDATSGERDGVSPALQKPIKGRGDSAWETLMNVAALVPPLPTRTTAPAKKPAPALVAASPGSTTGTPTKRVKSKYGDLEALSNAGESYSSKYRAANNDVVPNQQRWEDMFIRLGIFKEKHNHCRVPNRYPDVSTATSLAERSVLTYLESLFLQSFALTITTGPIIGIMGRNPTSVLQEQESTNACRSCEKAHRSWL